MRRETEKDRQRERSTERPRERKMEDNRRLMNRESRTSSYHSSVGSMTGSELDLMELIDEGEGVEGGRNNEGSNGSMIDFSVPLESYADAIGIPEGVQPGTFLPLSAPKSTVRTHDCK